MDKELIDKGILCLIENLGYSAANEFLHQIVKNNISYFDYTEWQREHLFEGMTDEEIVNGAIEYAKNHPNQ